MTKDGGTSHRKPVERGFAQKETEPMSQSGHQHPKQKPKTPQSNNRGQEHKVNQSGDSEQGVTSSGSADNSRSWIRDREGHLRNGSNLRTVHGTEERVNHRTIPEKEGRTRSQTGSKAGRTCQEEGGGMVSDL